jgi:transaldolase
VEGGSPLPGGPPPRRKPPTPQRPLWASTGTKDPRYSDVLYVSELIGPEVVNTMPEQTLHAFGDHGEVARTIDVDPRGAEAALTDAAREGVDLDAVTAALEQEGIQSFCASYQELLDRIEAKLGTLGGPRTRASLSDGSG